MKKMKRTINMPELNKVSMDSVKLGFLPEKRFVMSG